MNMNDDWRQQEQRVNHKKVSRVAVAVPWVAVVLTATSYKQHQLDCLQQASLPPVTDLTFAQPTTSD